MAPIDPSIEARLEELIEATIAKRQREVAAGAPSPALREVWADFRRLVLDLDPATTSEPRKDARAFRSSMPLLLDDTFDFQGRRMKLGDMPVASITIEMVEAWREHMRSRPRRDGRKGPLKPNYRNRILSGLQTLMEWAWRTGRGCQPLRGIKAERDPNAGREGYFRNEAELDEYCQYLPLIVADIFRFCCEPGCTRRGEAVMLEWDEVNWRDRVIDLPAHKTKNGTPRTFPVSDKAFAMLERRRATARPGNPYVFQAERPEVPGDCTCEALMGRPPHRNGHVYYGLLQRSHEKARKRSGIKLGPKKENPTTHHGRHTGATYLAAKSNGNIQAVKDFGGWRSSSIADKYIKRTAAVLEEVRAMSNLSMDDVVKGRREALQGTRLPPQAAPTHRQSLRSRRTR